MHALVLAHQLAMRLSPAGRPLFSTPSSLSLERESSSREAASCTPSLRVSLVSAFPHVPCSRLPRVVPRSHQVEASAPSVRLESRM